MLDMLAAETAFEGGRALALALDAGDGPRGRRAPPGADRRGAAPRRARPARARRRVRRPRGRRACRARDHARSRGAVRRGADAARGARGAAHRCRASARSCRCSRRARTRSRPVSTSSRSRSSRRSSRRACATAPRRSSARCGASTRSRASGPPSACASWPRACARTSRRSSSPSAAARPVLAVRADARSAVPGIVHDASGSGQTLFVEPFALVEQHNRLRELVERGARGGRAHPHRAVRRRSARRHADVTAAVDAIAELDLALACGSARAAHAAAAPVRAGRRRRARRGRAIRCSTPRSAVPIDLPLAGVRTLVVSGANAGGKTVALKTLGLAAALHQCGLRPPARTARLPVFDADPGRRRRRAVDRAQPLDVLRPPPLDRRDRLGRPGRARWCCSTRSRPAPTRSRARRSRRRCSRRCRSAARRRS